MHRSIIGIALAFAAVIGPALHAQAPDADRVNALVAAATRYVEAYQQKLSAVVCEERQTQRLVSTDGRIHTQRDLVSEFLLVKVGARTLGFRDVSSVDGRPVRDRQERLQKLFLDSPGRPPLAQAGKIAQESARYNLGFPRDMDALMVPLAILSAKHVADFHFTAADEGLAFEEVSSPSLIQYRDRSGVHDLPLRGRLQLDMPGGRLLGATVTADNPLFTVTVDVRYAENPALGLLVPVEAGEHYRAIDKPREDRLEVTSSYSGFRRFEVTVQERFDR